MAKKEWKLVPESDLTEEEVRRGFNRLRELYKEAMDKLHERKVEKTKLNITICELKKENSTLIKEVKHLNYLLEKANDKLEKTKMANESKVEKDEKSDFKKKFFDSL